MTTALALLLLTTAAAPPDPAPAPDPPVSDALRDYNAERLERGRNANIALTAWGGANLLAGAIGWPLAETEQWRAFHAMNLSWGAVNLAIAIPGLVRNLNTDPGDFDLAETLRAESSLHSILLLNLGLDVAYLTAGALMWERGEFGNDALLTGFGQSVVVQGAFLFVYDIVYALLTSNASGALYTRIGKDHAEVGWAGRF